MFAPISSPHHPLSKGPHTEPQEHLRKSVASPSKITTMRKPVASRHRNNRNDGLRSRQRPEHLKINPKVAHSAMSGECDSEARSLRAPPRQALNAVHHWTKISCRVAAARCRGVHSLSWASIFVQRSRGTEIVPFCDQEHHHRNHPS